MPSTRRSGVDNALPNVSRPLRSSNTAISVKVPPMSAARRMLAPLPARDRLLRAMLLLHSGGLRDRLPARGFRRHESRKRSRRHRFPIEGVLREFLLHVRSLHDPANVLVEPLHDLVG